MYSSAFRVSHHKYDYVNVHFEGNSEEYDRKLLKFQTRPIGVYEHSVIRERNGAATDSFWIMDSVCGKCGISSPLPLHFLLHMVYGMVSLVLVGTNKTVIQMKELLRCQSVQRFLYCGLLVHVTI